MKKSAWRMGGGGGAREGGGKQGDWQIRYSIWPSIVEKQDGCCRINSCQAVAIPHGIWETSLVKQNEICERLVTPHFLYSSKPSQICH
jgi:hypothetical protein